MATSVLATGLGLHGEYKPEEQDLFTDTLEGTQKDALAANRDILPEAIDLASLINDANTTELLKVMERMMPGYMAGISKGVRNASALMSGELPADVQRNIADWAAQRGISSGTTGSEFADSSEIWKYGISTLEGQQRGLNQFLSIAERAPRAPIYDFTKMFISAEDLFSTRLAAFNTNLPIKLYNEWARNQPGNWERAAGAFLDWAATEGTSIMNMGIGGAMGGGGGGMMGAEAPTSEGVPGGYIQNAPDIGTGEGAPMDFGPDYFSKSPYFG